MSEPPPDAPMATRPDLGELLSAYVDHEVSDAERAIIDAALADPSAAAELAGFEAVHEQLVSMAVPVAPPEFWREVRGGVERRRRLRVQRLTGVALGAAAAVVAAVAIAVPGLVSRNGPVPPGRPVPPSEATAVTAQDVMLRVFGLGVASTRPSRTTTVPTTILHGVATSTTVRAP